MPNDHGRHWSAILVGLVIAKQTHAAPIEGEFASNAAALLVVLGVWAIFMGARNLRELRHKRMTPERHHPKPSEKSSDPSSDDE